MSEKPPHEPPDQADAAEPEASGTNGPDGAGFAGAEEQARAASLARLIDRLSAGEPPPPAMPAEERLLLDTAAMIRAAHVAQPLQPRQVNAIVADALAEPGELPRRVSRLIQFPGARQGGEATQGAAGAEPAGRASVSGIDLRPRSARIKVAVGGLVLAMAAALALWLWSGRRGPGGAGGGGGVAAAGLPSKLVSRSAGPLLGGPIASVEAAEARARLDLVYADRMNGYRELVFRGQIRRGIAGGEP